MSESNEVATATMGTNETISPSSSSSSSCTSSPSLLTFLLDYLRFLRAHAAALAISFVLLGYLVAGGNLLSLEGIEWLAFGLGFSCVGFGDNNIQDYSSDIKDKNKACFPLGRTIPIKSARRFLLALQIIGLVVAFYLSRSLPAFGIFVLMYGSGLVYNRKNKTSVSSPLFASLTFAPLALFSYFSSVQSVDYPILAITILAFIESLWMGIFGNMKDVTSDETSSAKKLGIEVVNGLLLIPRRARILSLILKLLELIPISIILLISIENDLSVYLSWISLTLFGLTLWVTYSMMRSGSWESRNSYMKKVAMSEIGVFYSLIAALSSQIGIFPAIFLALFPLLWYAGFTRVLWGKYMAQIS